MSAIDIGVLHGRYIRLTDRFKSVWTYHQFASAVFKNFLGAPLPYTIDFQSTYDRIKGVSAMLNAAQAGEAAANIDLCELALERASEPLLRVDDQITTPVVRRFFEKLKKQDETIVQNLIKFYFYADAVEGDRRDKLDYLFTRIGEDFVADRGEYWSRDSLEFRERVIALVSLLRPSETPQDEVVRVILAIRALRDQIQSASRIEELTQKNLLRNARQFKHRLGDFYFNPDVLLAIVELNVATKNKFLRLYHEDEKKIVEDSQKLLEHGDAIERNFGDTNPELLREIARFRSAKEQFDRSRASSNVKHDTITQLKQSMTNILSQLDRGLGFDEEETTADLPPAFFTEAEQAERITGKFGVDLLQPYLARIATVVDSIDPLLMPEEAAEIPAARELRLEPWEIAAYQKLFDRRPAEGEDDNDELWMLYVRAAALRMKIDEEATMLAASRAAGVAAESDLLSKAKGSLDCAKELDEEFNTFLHEALYYTNARIVHQLYRSRFRLLRGFSGLWLIYDAKPVTAI
jgi:hypothetical protein